MIYLKAATKFHFSEDKPPRLVFRPTTLALPTDRRVAILGERLQGKIEVDHETARRLFTLICALQRR